MLGALIADDLGHCWNVPAFVVDPVVVDEMEPCAKLSGLAGIERRSVFHALNTKSVVRKAAASLGIAYEDGRFIAVHMGGGITVSAHRYGRVIDVNDAMGGDGPFTPDRSGSLPVGPIIDMCFSGEYTYEQMREFISQKGGVQSYLGTNDMREVETMIKQGDEFAALVTGRNGVSNLQGHRRHVCRAGWTRQRHCTDRRHRPQHPFHRADKKKGWTRWLLC